MPENNKQIDIIYNQTKHQVISAVNQIANQNKLPTFLVSLMLKEIATETANLSFEMLISQNEIISKDEYAEYVKLKNNQNDKNQE